MLATAMAVAVFASATVEPAGAQGPPSDPAGTAVSTLDVVTDVVKDWLAIVGAGVTTAAVVGGAILARRNAQIFRAKSPHVAISHEVSHRPVGDSYVHIFVTAVLHNSSRVHIEFLDGFAAIRQIRPVTDDDVEFLYDQVFVERGSDNLEWPYLDVLRHRWDRDGLLVEPGETETEIFDFIVQRDVESVAVTTYFYNSRVVGPLPDDSELDTVKRRNRRFLRWLAVRGPVGWGRTAAYDIVNSE